MTFKNPKTYYNTIDILSWSLILTFMYCIIDQSKYFTINFKHLVEDYEFSSY